MIDFRQLERRSYGATADGETGRVRLTPELLGQLISCVLQLEGGAEGAVTSSIFQEIFLDPNGTVPESIAEVLHIEDRVGGIMVEEMTRMAVASQASGVAGRMNPDNVSMIPKTDRLQAHTLLSHYAVRFPSEIEWLRRVVRQRASLPAGA